MPDDRREPSEAFELFLLALRYRDSRLVTRGGNEPFLLSGTDQAWLVYKGAVDVFAVQIEEDEPVGARHHLFRAYTNQLLLGLDLTDQAVGLLAVCAADTEILTFSRDRLRQQLDKSEHIPIIAGMLETWLRALMSGVAPEIKPKDYRRIESSNKISLKAGQIAGTAREVMWIKHLSGSSQLMGRDDLPAIAGGTLIPLSGYDWLQATEDSTLRPYDTAAILKLDAEWAYLDKHHMRLLHLIRHDMGRARQSASERIQDQTVTDDLRIQTAVLRLASAWSDEQMLGVLGIDVQNELVAACHLIGQALGVTIKTPPDFDTLPAHKNALDEIARASRLRIRTVLLRDGWETHDNGPLLAYCGDEYRPVALLPVNGRHYAMHDPVTGKVLPVDEALADNLRPTAYMLYRPFPDRALGAWDLITFGLRGARRDVLVVLLVGILGGVLGILTPLITGVIFDEMIPTGKQSQLIVLGSVLAISALATALFQLVRSIALLRIEGRMDSAIQAAVWDRLLSLPPNFFRQYPAGDLAERALGITRIKQVLSGAVLLAFLAGLFSWFYMAVLFYYDAQFALITILFVILATLITIGLSLRLLHFQRQVDHKQGEISGLTAQLIGGIAKLRVAGAESRAYFLWADAFSRQKRLAFRAETIHNYLEIMVSGLPVLASMALFAAMYNQTSLTTGAFIAFYAAFTLFMSAGLQMAVALVSVVSIVPTYERLTPILRALPEVDGQKVDPGELTGAIEVNHVSFRYNPDGPLVLDDVTFTVRSGEFVALVGPSGSGKSTLLRHLLGFEMPDSGAVYYDGHSLREVDLRAVRRQIGVVLQHSQVMTGSILDNILGASKLSVEDAWDAARRAGIAADIEQMPMGMQTYISEGGSTFSGGQRQRLLIARALVTHPRIIFFDEATSALDDRSQALVTESLKQIDATRIVIAHRLSTIRDADRIIVLERGKLVEMGTYETLMDRRGAFANLAQRQLV